MKKIILRSLKLLVDRATLIPFVYRSLSFLTKNKAVIFYLHRIEDKDLGVRGHSVESIEKTLSFFQQEGFQFLTLQAFIEAAQQKEALPKKAMCFTLDDGYLDQAITALPVFEKYNCPITIFLITNFTSEADWPWYEKIKYIYFTTEKNNIDLTVNGFSVSHNMSETSRAECAREVIEWFKTLPEGDLASALIQLCHVAAVSLPCLPPVFSQPITWRLARSVESPNVVFAPHSMTHNLFSRISRERALEEMSESWAMLEKELHNPLKVFCFPNGRRDFDFTQRDVDIAKELNFSAVLTTDDGYVQSNQASKYIFNRISFPQNLSGAIKAVIKMDSFRFEIDRNINKRMIATYGGKRGMVNYYVNMLKSYFGLYSQYKAIDWSQVDRFVFICKGNICRSAYADVVAKKRFANVLSFGVDTSSNKPANANAITIADEKGVDLRKHKTSQIENYRPKNGDLVIGMENFHLDIFRKKVRQAKEVQLTLIGLWSIKKNPYLHDPYSSGDAYFRECFHRIDESVDLILAHQAGSKE